MSILTPYQINSDARQFRVAQSMAAALRSGDYYLFVSHWDPWFDSRSGHWASRVSTDGLATTTGLETFDPAWAADIMSGLMCVKRLGPADVRLVFRRFNDFLGIDGQSLPTWNESTGLVGLGTRRWFTSETAAGDALFLYELTNTSHDALHPESFSVRTSDAITATNGVTLIPGTQSNAVLLAEVSAADLEFVTRSYCPIPENLDLVYADFEYGGITAVHVSSAGSGYSPGQAIVVDSDSGTGFDAVVAEVDGAGAILRVSVMTPGLQYLTGDALSVSGAGSGAVLSAVISPSANDLAERLSPTSVMVKTQIALDPVTAGSPLKRGWHAYTVGLIARPLTKTGVAYVAPWGTGVTSVTLALGEASVMSFDPRNTRAEVQFVHRGSGDPVTDWNSPGSLAHVGDLIGYQVNGTSLTLDFCDRLALNQWLSDGQYDLRFNLRSWDSDGQMETIWTEQCTGAVMTSSAGQQLSVTADGGQIVYAQRVDVPPSEDHLPGWFWEPNFLREFRLVLDF